MLKMQICPCDRVIQGKPPVEVGDIRAVVVGQVVTHRTTDREVLGLIPTGSWAFFSILSYQQCVLNQVPHGGATLLIFLFKKCLAVQLEAKQA